MKCAECPLLHSPYIEGSGNTACCKIMVVGTAPGAREEEREMVFMGAAGQLVRDLMEYMNIDGNAYYTNVLKRRPIAYDGRNRKPSRQECYSCGHHLLEEIISLQPEIIVALGQMPLEFFTSPKMKISVMHGLPLPLIKFNHTFMLVPAYDPAFILRRGGIDSEIGDTLIDDLLEARRMVKSG